MLAYDCCKQKKPVDSSQSIVPQAQSIAFVALPSVVVHAVVKRRFDIDIGKELDPSIDPCVGTLSAELIPMEAWLRCALNASGSKRGSDCIACATGNVDK